MAKPLIVADESLKMFMGGRAPWFLVIIFLISFTAWIIKTLIRKSEDKKIRREEEQSEEYAEEDAEEDETDFSEVPVDTDSSELTLVKAKVVEKNGVDTYSKAFPPYEYRMVFVITFEKEDGETITVEVPEEAFKKIELGDSGDLIMNGDKFFDFDAGEDNE